MTAGPRPTPAATREVCTQASSGMPGVSTGPFPARSTGTMGRDISPSAASIASQRPATGDTSIPGISKGDTPSPAGDGTSLPLSPCAIPISISIGYTEEGAGSLNLSIDSRNYDMFQSGLGTSLSRPFLWQDSRLMPEVHVKWLYDFIGDRQQTTSTFTGGGASFSTGGYDPPQSSLNAGARLTLINRYGVTVSVNYDWNSRRIFTPCGYANFARF